MFRKRDTELIILEVLACQDDNDKRSIKHLKENDESFSWRDLGKYQNLAAALPLKLKPELPSDFPKELFVRKLNRLIFGKEEIAEPEKFVPGKHDKRDTDPKENIAEDKIDWDSLSVFNSNTRHLSGFEEVRAKTTPVKKEYTKTKNKEEAFQENDFSDIHNDEAGFKTFKERQKHSTFKKLVLTSVVLFVVIVAISVYMVFSNHTEVVQVKKEQLTKDNVIAGSNELKNDSADIFQPIIQESETIQTNYQTANVQKIEIPEKTDIKKQNLPKAPPKLPDPMEAPLITTTEIVSTEESKVEEEISVPPPKEEIGETEEPVFFVVVEEMPQPIGGLQGIQQKIKYPEIAKRAGVEGKVFVRAFVDEEGNVVNAEVIKGIGAGCDEAALEAILKTKFTPGKQRGKPIKVQVTVPVLFKL